MEGRGGRPVRAEGRRGGLHGYGVSPLIMAGQRSVNGWDSGKGIRDEWCSEGRGDHRRLKVKHKCMDDHKEEVENNGAGVRPSK